MSAGMADAERLAVVGTRVAKVDGSWVINPTYERQLFVHPMGRIMAGVALGFQLLGMWTIHKIVNIKV